MANYANVDHGGEFKMPSFSLKFAKPVFALMAKSPANTAFAFALATSLSWAAANALYFQSDVHPAPLFAPAVENAVAPVAPVTPAPSRPVTQPVVQQEPVASVSPSTTDFGPITGNPDAFLVQSKLFELGYFKEKVDGYYGPKTAAAIRAFELENGLASTGAISDDLIAILSTGTVKKQSAAPQAMPTPVTSNGDPLLQIAQQATADSNASDVAQRELTMKAQRGLASLGYDVGEIDGIAGEATATAIRRFENFYNYRQTGVVSPELIDMLKEANAKF